MNSNIQEYFIKLFEDAQKQTEKFGRNIYEDSFESFYKENKEMLVTVYKLIEESEDKEALIGELSRIIPDYVKDGLAGIEKKSKRDSLVMDYNLALVTYVLPVMNYGREKNCRALSDAIVKQWNQGISKTAVKNAVFEEIIGGFKNLYS